MPVEKREAEIDEILAESFPASDPPPWTCGVDAEAIRPTPADGVPGARSAVDGAGGRRRGQ